MSQIATSKKGRGGRRYPPLALTEHGVLMLPGALNSERAIPVNIQIIENHWLSPLPQYTVQDKTKNSGQHIKAINHGNPLIC